MVDTIILRAVADVCGQCDSSVCRENKSWVRDAADEIDSLRSQLAEARAEIARLIERCPECEGEKEITVYRVTPYIDGIAYSHSPEVVPCPKCDGTGKKKAKVTSE